MSLYDIREKVESFCHEVSNEVIVINGNWGTGKTFLWREIIENVRKQKKIGKPVYSYVSLFGLNNINDIKDLIIASSSTSNDILTNKIIRKVSGITKQAMSKAENIPLIQEWTGGIVRQFVFMGFQNAIICFDDMERKSNELSIKDILGLASLLKDQHNCKIVFILNYDMLSEKDRNDFRSYGEKIVDLEVNFSPGKDDIYRYVFNDSYKYNSLAKEYISRLNISNIRILEKIKKNIDLFSPLILRSSVIVTDKLIKLLVLFTWCNYEKPNGDIVLNYIKNDEFSYHIKLVQNKEISSEESYAHNLLSTYGYYDRLDDNQEMVRIVLHTIRNGYMKRDDVIKVLEEEEAKSKTILAVKSFDAIWDMYHNDYNLNEDDFVLSLKQSFDLNKSYLKFSALNSVVSVLKALDRRDEALLVIDDFLDFQFNTLKEISVNITGINDLIFIQGIEDVDIIDKIKSLKFQYDYAISDIMDIVIQERFGRREIEFINNVDPEDLYIFIKNAKVNTGRYIRSTIRLAEHVLGTGGGDAPMKKISIALNRIGMESNINKVRLEQWFNIKITPEDL